MTARTILHVDLDAFFAAVEQRDRPELRGRPVVVGGGGGEDARGVVSAASYEARVFGIHSAMSLREAYRRCPDAVFLPVDGRRYQAASRDVMSILRRYPPLVEPISIDEAFLDVTGSAALFGDGPTIAGRIKDETRAEVGLTASVGVASTKLVAKIASDLRKPDGLVVVPVGEESAFLAPLQIGRLWGVGEKTAAALREYSVRTIGDLAALPPDLLVRRFGKHGASLVDRARGIDPDPVHDGDPAKSVGHEHTFEVDTSDPEVIERLIRINYLGGVWCLRAFLPGLRAAAPSDVVNIVSVSGVVAGPPSGPYSASKHAQLAFSRTSAAELRGEGIRVHTVKPGFTETEGFPQSWLPRRVQRLVIGPGDVAAHVLRSLEAQVQAAVAAGTAEDKA